MNQVRNQDAVYFAGDGDRERQRLQEQAIMVGPFTRRLFEAAGIGPGMRVLDVGSGMGDVALLIADLVGPTGSVLGVDTNAEILEAARRRVPSHVSFLAGDIRSIALEGEFDAVVGRAVLMYVQDPAATVAQAIRNLRAGGVAAFLELELAGESMVGAPRPPIYKQMADWRQETFRRSGVEMRMGSKLRRTLLDAGLTSPELQASSTIGSGTDWVGFRYLEETMRSMLPLMESWGVVTPAEVDIDTVAARLGAESVLFDTTVMMNPWIGAWGARKP